MIKGPRAFYRYINIFMISEHLFDVFSKEELNAIKIIAEKISQQKHPTHSNTYTNGFTPIDPIYPAIKKLVIDKINQHSAIKIQKLTVGQILQTQNPFGVHSDFMGKGDNGEGQAFLIPLWQTPEPNDENRTTTIVFDQTWTTSQLMSDYIATNPDKPTNNAESIWEKHMGHDSKIHAEYLSVKMLCPWIYGSVISWNRRLLHSSNNFPAFGIEEKCALVLFCQ
jgi:hypothetical protein